MIVRLKSEPFDAGVLLSGFCRDRLATGAVVSFTGIARGEAGGDPRLELEAYPGFTDVEIERIAKQSAARFSLHDLLIVHRVGLIATGEAIVFVAAAAAHRREAFEACDQLMDYLKSRAPFWKKEHGEDGARWIEPTERDLIDAKRWD